VGAVADGQLLLHRDPRGLQRLHLFNQRGGVDDYAVPDDGFDAFPENPAGDELEDVLLFADIDGVAGIVTALVARDDVELTGEEVDHLALALVSPLRAQDYDITHVIELKLFILACVWALGRR
jgi:hypothetical protein